MSAFLKSGVVTSVSADDPLPTTAAFPSSQIGTQGTGSIYNQPTGGTGLLGYLSGIFKSVLTNATEATLASVLAIFNNLIGTATLDTLNSIITVAIGNRAAVGLQLTGTNAGATVTFYASQDGGTTYIPVNIIPLSSGGDNNPVSTATASGNWVFIGGGFTHFQAKLTVIGSGSFTASSVATPSVRNVGVTAIGSSLDTVAATDTGTYTLIALIKRIAQRLSSKLFTQNFIYDTTGVYSFDPDSCSNVVTRNADNTVATDTYTDPVTGFVFRQTLTYTSGVYTSSTGWVKI